MKHVLAPALLYMQSSELRLDVSQNALEIVLTGVGVLQFISAAFEASVCAYQIYFLSCNRRGVGAMAPAEQQHRGFPTYLQHRLLVY